MAIFVSIGHVLRDLGITSGVVEGMQVLVVNLNIVLVRGLVDCN